MPSAEFDLAVDAGQGGAALGSERELAGAAFELAALHGGLTATERGVARGNVAAGAIDHLRRLIEAGEDPLGAAFCSLRSASGRRRGGAVYTPPLIVEAMLAWARTSGRPVRVVDPGAGSGRFLAAAADAFPAAELVAVEIDPLAALVLRANAVVRGFADRLTVVVGDYRDLDLPPVPGPTLFIGNPPYVRHHDIDPAWKDWLATTASALGYRASKLAGLHVYFALKTCLLAKDGDYGAFITSAEWLDVNYGDLLRRLVTHDLGGVFVYTIAPSAMPFADATTTGAILGFRKGYAGPVRLKTIPNLAKLESASSPVLAGGRTVARPGLARARRWSALFRPKRTAPSNFVELGELCRVHRGQVTGCNRAWIAGPEASRLPMGLLKPAVTRARELIAAAPTLAKPDGLRRVVDLPPDLDSLTAASRRRVADFLAWAKAAGADRAYVARHRQAWWAVDLKPPAPILCTYMARRPPAFVRNLCDARHLNIAHGLYPRDELSAASLDALSLWLQQNVGVDAGRTYAGGLTKFEPKEVERILIPPPEELFSRRVPAGSSR